MVSLLFTLLVCHTFLTFLAFDCSYVQAGSDLFSGFCAVIEHRPPFWDLFFASQPVALYCGSPLFHTCPFTHLLSQKCDLGVLCLFAMFGLPCLSYGLFSVFYMLFGIMLLVFLLCFRDYVFLCIVWACHSIFGKLFGSFSLYQHRRLPLHSVHFSFKPWSLSFSSGFLTLSCCNLFSGKVLITFCPCCRC